MLFVPAAAFSILGPLVLQQRFDFSLLSSAYGLGKSSKFEKEELSADAFKDYSNSTEQHPWSTQRLNCGEDSFFISKDAIGVADGVGGWTEYGVDPSKISNQLMKNCLEEVSRIKTPKKILHDAYYRIINERQVDAGSTTAIIAQICSQQEEADKKKKKKSSKKEKKVKKDDNLCVANLGDSTCVVLRPRNGSYEVIFRSKEQQHYFNCPFQLAVLPKGEKHDRSIQDKPEQSKEYTVPIEVGDLVILGTDGLFDNLFIEEIKKIVVDSEREFVEFSKKSNLPIDDEKVKKRNFWISKKLVAAARIKGEDSKCSTPFALNAVAHRKFFNGGKLDDVTCICASVVQ